jgi:hypothetical protein
MMATGPVQVTRVAELVLATDPDMALELFEPVGEGRWASGWAPRFIYPPDGTAEVGAVFARDSNPASLWLIADYDRDARRIVYAVFVPDVRVTRLEIQCVADDSGTTRASIAYTHTSLGERGDAYLARFTEEHYAHEMGQWQSAIAAYLDGKPLVHH